MPTRFPTRPRRHKYGVAPTERRTYMGVLYDSAAEVQVAWELDCRLKAGEITGWERQVVFPLVVNGQLIKKYKIDFVVFNKDGTKEYLEVKVCDRKTSRPYWARDGKITWNLFKALYESQLCRNGHSIKLIVLQGERDA